MLGQLEPLALVVRRDVGAVETRRALGHAFEEEPSHALAHVAKIAPELPSDHLICMNLCGRGDKDIFTVAKALGVDIES